MASASEKTILVVDDEPDVRNFIAACLEDAGFMVQTAKDGEDALHKLKASPPDLMTLDMIMPRKSGIQVLRELRKDDRFSDLPIIVISAHADDEFGSADFKNFDSFTSGLKPRCTIEKPVSPKKLLQVVSEILSVEYQKAVVDSAMSQNGVRNILFCSDFSDDANFAFSHAAYECKKYKAGLHIMHVILSPASYTGPGVNLPLLEQEYPDEESRKEKIEEQALLALKRHYESKLSDSIVFSFAIRFGSPDVEIIKYAEENDIQMIVLGVVGRPSTHRGRMLKTAANVAKYASCQVVTIGRSNR